jgi:integrase
MRSPLAQHPSNARAISRLHTVGGLPRKCLLRAVFNSAIRTKYVRESPFKVGTETAVRLAKEHARSRRLDAGEAEVLPAACGPHLRAIVECALETGMRRGEILSLQWREVEGLEVDGQTISWAPKAALFLPHEKTKTKTDRWVPISSRLNYLATTTDSQHAAMPQFEEARKGLQQVATDAETGGPTGAQTAEGGDANM